MQPAKLQGTALFMALLIITIVISIAAGLLRLQKNNIHRINMLINNEQIMLYAASSVDWAQAVLLQNENSKKIINWPLHFNILSQKNLIIKAQLYDAQALFNLNNLQNLTTEKITKELAPTPINNYQTIIKQPAKILANILDALKLKLNQAQKIELIYAISAWISTLSTEQFTLPPADAFDQLYQRQNPAYRAPHFLMRHVSELRLVNGMTATIYTALQPYIIALPQKTTLNIINSPSLIKNAVNFIPQANQTPNQINNKSTPSQYFFLITNFKMNGQNLVLHTLLVRAGSQDKSRLVVIWQNFSG